jgi:hypothetical protein
MEPRTADLVAELTGFDPALVLPELYAELNSQPSGAAEP